MEKFTAAIGHGLLSTLLTGVDIRNLRGPLPMETTVYSSGQPTEQELAELAQRGVTTIINLRPQVEMVEFDEQKLVSELGMTYQQIAVASEADLTLDNAQRLAAALKSSLPPILIHCAGGNRVGALLAIKAGWIDGLTAPEALKFGVEAGLAGLRDAVVSLLGSPPTGV